MGKEVLRFAPHNNDAFRLFFPILVEKCRSHSYFSAAACGSFNCGKSMQANRSHLPHQLEGYLCIGCQQQGLDGRIIAGYLDALQWCLLLAVCLLDKI